MLVTQDPLRKSRPLASSRRSPGLLLISRGGEEVPASRQTREFPRIASGKGHAGASHEIRHDARHENLAGASFAHDACGGIDGDASDILAARLDFAAA